MPRIKLGGGGAEEASSLIYEAGGEEEKRKGKGILMIAERERKRKEVRNGAAFLPSFLGRKCILFLPRVRLFPV